MIRSARDALREGYSLGLKGYPGRGYKNEIKFRAEFIEVHERRRRSGSAHEDYAEYMLGMRGEMCDNLMPSVE